MVKIFSGILLVILLYSCATPSENHQRTIALKNGNIGILSLRQDTLDDTTFTYLRDIHRETVLNSYIRNGIKTVQYLDEVMSSKDSAFIQSQAIEICQRSKLDAIIISEISNISVNNNYTNPGYPLGIPLPGGVTIGYSIGRETGVKIDLDIEMKLIDKDGKFLMSSLGSSKPGMLTDNRTGEEILRSAIKNTSNKIVGKIKQSRYLN